MKYPSLIIMFLLLISSSPSRAQSVLVRTGEHDGFTRLVLILPQPVEWQLGRTDMGYEVNVFQPQAAQSPQRVAFDLSNVFNLIGRERLRSIRPNLNGNGLILGIPCACHIIPFEHTNKILVLDIRDGAPPLNSSFELSFDSANTLPPLKNTSSPPPRPRARPGSSPSSLGYNWLEASRTAPSGLPVPHHIGSSTQSAAEQPELRSALIESISRGASAGFVTMNTQASTSNRLEKTADMEIQLADSQPLPGGLRGMAVIDPQHAPPPDDRWQNLPSRSNPRFAKLGRNA